MTTTTLPALPASDLPTVPELNARMIELGCILRDGACLTHHESLLVHDGGRVACRAAWSSVEGGI